MDLTITLKADSELLKALLKLTGLEQCSIKDSEKGIQPSNVPAAQPPVPPVIPHQNYSVPTQNQASQQNYSVPVSHQPPAPVQPVPIAPSVPVQAPGYTLEQLTYAATALLDAGKLQDVQNLLGAFGVQAMTMLPKERYGEFALALRQMGAKI